MLPLHRRLPVRLLALAAILCGGLATPSRAAQQERTRLAYRHHPLLELHMLVRTASADSADSDVAGLEGLDAAVQAARELEQALGGENGAGGGAQRWGLVEPMIAASGDVRRLRSLFERLPERQRLRDGGDIRLRAPATAYAEALAALEPDFAERIWPERRLRIERGEARLREGFAGREAECIAYLVESLGMKDPQLEVRVFLVADAPAPGAFTHRGREGAVCIVSVAEEDDGVLAEMVLHELIHVLEVAATDEPGALRALREALVARGIDERSAAYRDLPHTLMFVQAAETVRRHLDPAHEAYGDVRGYYEKVPAAAAAVRPAWEAYLDGKITRDQAIRQIAKRAAEQAVE